MREGFEQYAIENLDFFFSMFPFEVVYMFLVQGNESDRANIDALLDNPQDMLDLLSSEMGEISDQQLMDEVPEVGEQATGIRARMAFADQPFQMEMVVFCRQLVVGFVGTMYPLGEEPVVSTVDAALLLDERLEAALQDQ
jgi:hypothetical protein